MTNRNIITEVILWHDINVVMALTTFSALILCYHYVISVYTCFKYHNLKSWHTKQNTQWKHCKCYLPLTGKTIADTLKVWSGKITLVARRRIVLILCSLICNNITYNCRYQLPQTDQVYSYWPILFKHENINRSILYKKKKRKNLAALFCKQTICLISPFVNSDPLCWVCFQLRIHTCPYFIHSL